MYRIAFWKVWKRWNFLFYIKKNNVSQEVLILFQGLINNATFVGFLKFDVDFHYSGYNIIFVHCTFGNSLTFSGEFPFNGSTGDNKI